MQVRSVTVHSSTLQVNAVPRQDLPPFWVIVMRPTRSVYKWVKDRICLFLFVFWLFQSVLTFYIIFRMRAKTSEFLKVLNRAKIEEENTKKKTSFMGNRGQFIWIRETIHLFKCKTLTLLTNWFYLMIFNFDYLFLWYFLWYFWIIIICPLTLIICSEPRKTGRIKLIFHNNLQQHTFIEDCIWFLNFRFDFDIHVMLPISKWRK